MKKSLTVLLTAALGASLMTGCSTSAPETTAAETASSAETTAQLIPKQKPPPLILPQQRAPIPSGSDSMPNMVLLTTAVRAFS